MSKNIAYFGYGGGIFVFPPDGLLVKVPPKKSKEGEPAIYGEVFVKGNGHYTAPDDHILIQISTYHKEIRLVIGRRLNELQKRAIMSFCMGQEDANGYMMKILSCDSSIHFEADKFVQAYNSYVEA